jgi:D-psicose/D-tagatose/L-ribulose 3-epimerase
MKRTLPLGFSFLYFGARTTEMHAPWFGRLAHHGYQGAELPLAGATETDLRFLRGALRDAGLRATGVGFAKPEANPIAAEAAVRARAVDHLVLLAERAAAIGAEVVAGPMHSAYGVFPGHGPTRDEFARCVEVLQRAAERVAPLGVKLAMEPLNRFECYFLNTAAQCWELVRAVGHPNIVGALDTHHAHLEEDDAIDAILAGKGALGHVQLSENHRGTPGRGQVDFVATRKALERIGYDGWLVVECFSRRDPEFGNGLRIWRELDGGAEEVLAAGAALLRD